VLERLNTSKSLATTRRQLFPTAVGNLRRIAKAQKLKDRQATAALATAALALNDGPVLPRLPPPLKHGVGRRSPGWNKPCPCGSGKKRKLCCKECV